MSGLCNSSRRNYFFAALYAAQRSFRAAAMRARPAALIAPFFAGFAAGAASAAWTLAHLACDRGG